MSSTNRSKAREKHVADYYVTPQKPIADFLEKFCKDENINLNYEKWENKKYKILDPCAGWNPEYAVVNSYWEEVVVKAQDMSYPAVLFEFWADYNSITTNDIRKDSPACYHFDYTEWEGTAKYDIIITNPPFNIAQDIIKKSLELCEEWWYVIMLLRLNYFWWKVRQDFWKKNMPKYAYVHNRRMSFTQNGNTDSVEYMHCVWQKWGNPEETKLKIIYDF